MRGCEDDRDDSKNDRRDDSDKAAAVRLYRRRLDVRCEIARSASEWLGSGSWGAHGSEREAETVTPSCESRTTGVTGSE